MPGGSGRRARARGAALVGLDGERSAGRRRCLPAAPPRARGRAARLHAPPARRAGLVEDGIQETLLAVHKARHTYDPGRPFRPWLVAIARHKAIDLLRRGRNPGREGASHPRDAHTEARPENRPEAALEVARLLEGLPVTFREAIVLTKLQGRTVEEAARAAGVTATAMRTRVHRGMRQLRRRLDAEPL